MPSPRVWVLVPTAAPTGDSVLDTFYDFSGTRPELAQSFAELGVADWRWQPVTLDTHEAVIDAILASRASATPYVFNLCDGDAIHGYPGPEIVARLEQVGLPFTGARSEFYALSTSKIIMKRAFEACGVPTAPWAVLDADDGSAPLAETDESLAPLFEALGRPLIVKPAVSGGRMGIGLRSVVDTPAQLRDCLAWLRAGFHGWDTAAGGVFVERFIAGREFTVLVAGDHARPDTRRVLCPVERVFHPSLPERERFSSFERGWYLHDEESPMPEGAATHAWAGVEPALDAALRALAWEAYAAVRGTSFGRVDIRMAGDTGALYVLEVNSQPGLTGDNDPITGDSVGHIFHLDALSFTDFIGLLLREVGYPH